MNKNLFRSLVGILKNQHKKENINIPWVICVCYPAAAWITEIELGARISASMIRFLHLL